jgi:hypothetical protein
VLAQSLLQIALPLEKGLVFHAISRCRLLKAADGQSECEEAGFVSLKRGE